VKNFFEREGDALVFNPQAVLDAVHEAEMRKLVSW
jgi:hypothetical protein